MEKLTTVYLVRHGQTAANQTGVFQGQTDVPLDETGREQARLVGARLRELPFDRILASDLSRAAVTAEAIAGKLPQRLPAVESGENHRNRSGNRMWDASVFLPLQN